jgi:hypothetical protein
LRLSEEAENFDGQKNIAGEAVLRRLEDVLNEPSFFRVYAVIGTHENLYEHVVLDVGLAADAYLDDAVRVEMTRREHAGEHA